MAVEQDRILLIAPELGLELAPEVDALYPLGYYVQPITGDVSRERIFAGIAKREFGIIHYAGDAGPTGIRLSNDKLGQIVIMDAAALVQIARAVKARLVFLNGCSSIIVGQTLIDEHIPYCIATLADIDNVMARETAQLFYQALAETGDVRTAFARSKPPKPGAYICLNNGIKELSLKPVLDKLAEVAAFMARNDKEHQEMCGKVFDLKTENQLAQERMLHIFQRSRVWSIAVMLFGMFGIGLLAFLINLLSRGSGS